MACASQPVAVEVTVDSNAHENYYATELGSHCAHVHPGVKTKRAALDTGDFQITSLDPETGKRTATLIIERKTIRDLGASIAHEKHFFAQRARLSEIMKATPGAKCMLMVVGRTPDLDDEHVGGHFNPEKKEWCGGVSGRTFHEVLRKTMLRDGIGVVECPTSEIAALELCLLVDLMAKGALGPGEDCGLPADFTNIRNAAREDEPQAIAARMLAAIPGISLKGAEAVVKSHGGLVPLLNADAKDLAAIQVSEKRKLGAASAARIAKVARF